MSLAGPAALLQAAAGLVRLGAFCTAGPLAQLCCAALGTCDAHAPLAAACCLRLLRLIGRAAKLLHLRLPMRVRRWLLRW
jgi:hypothetical protein